jgi:hypothetical protein
MGSRKKRRSEPGADPPGVSVQPDPAETGAFIYTFTCRLPFRMGISDNFDQEISLPAEYANAEDAQTFAKPPFVRLRLVNATIPDRKFSPANAPTAVRQFYGSEYDLGPADEVDPHL